MHRIPLSRIACAAPFALLAIVLAACSGGDTSQNAPPRAANQAPPAPLERNQPFPDVTLTGLDSVKVNTVDLVRGHETIVLFISTACETCSELMTIWDRRARVIPAEVKVVLIVDEDVDYAAKYAAKSGIRFPLYCDTRSVFARQHKMEIYPTAVMVRPDGTMSFVRRGVTPLFTPDRAIMVLRRGERED
jgi:peroxiredoxin